MANIIISTNTIPTQPSNTKSSNNSNDEKDGGNTFQNMLSNQMAPKQPESANKNPVQNTRPNDKTAEAKDTSKEDDKELNNDPNLIVASSTPSPNFSPIQQPLAVQGNLSQSITIAEESPNKKAMIDLSISTLPLIKSNLPNISTDGKTMPDINQSMQPSELKNSFANALEDMKYADPAISKIDKQTLTNALAKTEGKEINNLKNAGSVDAMDMALLSAQSGISSGGVPVSHATPKLSVQAEINSYGWTNELANKLTYAINEKMQSAQLHLNPENLGPVEIRIQIDHDKQTSITFSAVHPDTRNILESAIPQLRSILTNNGINLNDCTVNPDTLASNMQQNRQQENPSSRNNQSPSTPIDKQPETVTTVKIIGSIDLFA